jgi:hypothetical protein
MKIHENQKRGQRKNRQPPLPKVPVSIAQEIQREVKKALSKSMEIKRAAFQQTISIGGFNATNFNTNQIRTVLPTAGGLSIAQGTGQGDRIGNHIRVKRATLRLTTWIQPYNAITNPTPTPSYYRLWLFSPKATAALPSATSLANFFQLGDSTQAPIGNIIDMNYDVNRDAYKLFRTYNKRIGYAAFVASPGGIGGQGYYSNNDSEMFDIAEIDMTPFYPKDLDFSDATIPPTNNVVCFWVEAVCQDGTTQSSGTVTCQTNYQILLEYTDA